MGRYASSCALTDDGSHPWASAADRFPDDTLLRLHGFGIAGRPKGAEAVWRLGDRLYTQSEALRSVGRAAA